MSIRTGVFAVFFFIILGTVYVLPTAPVLGNVDPHQDPADCDSCHTGIPDEEQAESGEYLLKEESIDATCHLCHPYDCCRINSLKGHNHPSNVSEWDVDNFTEPRSLPLHEGYITCNTCHYHLRPDGPDYKMVRMVKIKLDKVDWSELCADCHRGYL